MRHQDLAGLFHAGGDGLPVVGAQGAQVQDLDLDAVEGRLAGGQDRALDQCPIGDHRQVPALLHPGRTPEGDRVVRSGVGALVVDLAVEVLVLEEEDRVLATDGGAQEPVGVLGVRGNHHPQPGDVGEENLAALAVVDRAALQVAAVGHANDHRTGEGPVRAPADEGQLVADLHERRPDVVEELDLHDRLQAAGGHADGPPHDGGLGEGGVVDPPGSVSALEVVGDLEHPPLALHLVQALLAGAVRHVLPEDHDPRVPRHLVVQARVEQVHHRLGGAVGDRLGGRRRWRWGPRPPSTRGG